MGLCVFYEMYVFSYSASVLFSSSARVSVVLVCLLRVVADGVASEILVTVSTRYDTDQNEPTNQATDTHTTHYEARQTNERSQLDGLCEGLIMEQIGSIEASAVGSPSLTRSISNPQTAIETKMTTIQLNGNGNTNGTTAGHPTPTSTPAVKSSLRSHHQRNGSVTSTGSASASSSRSSGGSKGEFAQQQVIEQLRTELAASNTARREVEAQLAAAQATIATSTLNHSKALSECEKIHSSQLEQMKKKFEETSKQLQLAHDESMLANAWKEEVKSLKSIIEQKDQQIQQLTLKYDQQSVELHKESMAAHRLQMAVDLINKQIRYGEDYKTLLKYVTCKLYVVLYRQYQSNRQLHQSFSQLMKKVYSEEKRIRQDHLTGLFTPTQLQSNSQSTAPTTLNTPLYGPTPTDSKPTQPPVLTLTLTPAESNTPHTIITPKGSNASAGDGSMAVGPLSSPLSSSSFLLSTTSSTSSSYVFDNDRSSTDTSHPGPQNETFAWLSSDRSITLDEKSMFAAAAIARRERCEKIDYRLQYQITPQNHHQAQAQAHSQTPSQSQSHPSSTVIGGAVRSSPILLNVPTASRDYRRLRAIEKRARAQEEGETKRTFNLFAHWSKQRTPLLHEALTILTIALHESFTRERTSFATAKLFCEKNTQLMLEYGELQSSQSAHEKELNALRHEVGRLKSELQLALEQVCACTRIARFAAHIRDNRPQQQQQHQQAAPHDICVCECVDTCDCVMRDRQRRAHVTQQPQPSPPPTHASDHDSQPTSPRTDAGSHAESPPSIEAKPCTIDEAKVHIDDVPYSLSFSSISSRSSHNFQSSQSLSSLMSQFSTGLGSGRNGRTSGRFKRHSHTTDGEAHRSYELSTSSSSSSFHPSPAGDNSTNVNSVPFLQRTVKNLRSRLHAARTAILTLQDRLSQHHDESRVDSSDPHLYAHADEKLAQTHRPIGNERQSESMPLRRTTVGFGSQADRFNLTATAANPNSRSTLHPSSSSNLDELARPTGLPFGSLNPTRRESLIELVEKDLAEALNTSINYTQQARIDQDLVPFPIHHRRNEDSMTLITHPPSQPSHSQTSNSRASNTLERIYYVKGNTSGNSEGQQSLYATQRPQRPTNRQSTTLNRIDPTKGVKLSSTAPSYPAHTSTNPTRVHILHSLDMPPTVKPTPPPTERERDSQFQAAGSTSHRRRSRIPHDPLLEPLPPPHI